MASNLTTNQGVFPLALLERIVSSPANVFIADTRELAVQSAIAGSGIHAVNIPRTVIWPTLERFTNDNGAFPIFNPAVQDPDFVWSSTTRSSQSLGLAASSTVYTFSQSTGVDINVTVFADNALQMQIDLVNADTNAVISSPPLGTLLNDGSMNPATGVTIERPSFPYNWQNIRFYSISTGAIPAGRYKLILSFTVVNYEQFPGLGNPASLAFDADIHQPQVTPCGMPSCRWTEDPNNPIYNPPPPVKAFYQTVRYDRSGFRPFGAFSFYKMWYDFASEGGIALALSPNGIDFTFSANMIGLAAAARHSRVLFDRNGFGIGMPYRIWYWDSTFTTVDSANPADLRMIRTASSLDGVTWTGDTALIQAVDAPLVTVPGQFDGASTGPGDVLFFADNPAVVDAANPFNNRYVMYYNINDGFVERLAMAVSVDGISWRRAGPPIVLDVGGPGTWDMNKATIHVAVLRLSPTNFKMWYSGGVNTSAEGIGCASSSDGMNWVKFAGNPIFSIFDGVLWRNERTHNPWVLFDAQRFNGHGDEVCFKFWMTGAPLSDPNDIDIGYATNLNG